MRRLFAQRQSLVNVMRACVGLQPENFMLLESKMERAPSSSPLPPASSKGLWDLKAEESKGGDSIAAAAAATMK